MLSDSYITVSDLNGYLKTYLENNYFLQEIFIKGEISNFKRHQSGTFYFAIKDDHSRVSVVMFPLYAKRVQFPLKDGDMVLIKGKINVYEPSGSYSIHASELLFDSIGMLYVRYEELKKKLAEEGLFDESHKKPLPRFPKTIGIITAPFGAAIHDMVRTLKNRWPLCKVILFPSLVQGKEASADLVKKIQVADEYGVDVIICGRGGGSIEDLWPFNEEVVARAIYQCKTPIISAVGHQSDFTIADFVADVRALTPTDGAVQATPNLADVHEQISKEKRLLLSYFKEYLKDQNQVVARLKNSYLFKNPLQIYEKHRYKLDNLERQMDHLMTRIRQNQSDHLASSHLKLNHAMTQYQSKRSAEFQTLVARLDNLSPLKVLKRGYSFATIGTKSIQSVDDVKIDDLIALDVFDGVIKAIVKERKKQNE